MTIYEKLRLMHGERVEINSKHDNQSRTFYVSTPCTAEGVGCLIASYVVPEPDIQLHGQDLVAENILTYAIKVELPA